MNAVRDGGEERFRQRVMARAKKRMKGEDEGDIRGRNR